jgi:hypothetical protein
MANSCVKELQQQMKANLAWERELASEESIASEESDPGG